MYELKITANLLLCYLQRIIRKELSAQLTTTLQGVVDLDRFPKAVVEVAVLVLQVGPA
jgi:hypothetical protein